MKRIIQTAGLVLAATGLPSLAAAQDATLNSGDTAWILTATALVLFMSLPGLALFYGGLVRAKNYVSVLMKVYAIAALASIVWVIAGYSIAFGSANGWWGGLDNLFLKNLGRDAVSGTIPESVFLAFQMTFAVITPALIVGAFVERVKFLPVLIFTALWVLVVYAPVTHWICAGMALLVTHISASVATLVWVAIEALNNRKPTLVGAATGTIAGLATVTPAAGVLGPGGALLIGLAGGLVCYFAVHLIRVKLKIDDSLDVFAVHGVGGMLGILILPFLSAEFLGGTGEGVLSTQLIGTAAVVAWSAIASFVILLVLKITLGLRVTEEQEFEGLDVSLHGENAYN